MDDTQEFMQGGFTNSFFSPTTVMLGARRRRLAAFILAHQTPAVSRRKQNPGGQTDR